MLHSGGSVGSKGNSLDLDVGGKLSLGAPENVYITNSGDLHIASLDADSNADKSRDVSVTANGNIVSDAVITGGKAEISTLSGGNAGTSDMPLNLDVDRISGTISGDSTITNKGTLTVDDLTVGGKLELNAGGDVLAGDNAPGTANITAENAVIHAGGDVGKDNDPIVTAADRLSITADDISIHSITDLQIDSIVGKDVDIDVDGKTAAGPSQVNIKAEDLEITSYGGVGTADHPLAVEASGKVDISNTYGEQHTVNVYTAPIHDDEPYWTWPWYTSEPKEEVTEPEPEPEGKDEKPEPKPGGNGGKKEPEEESGWALTNFILTVVNMLLALMLLWLFLRKRRWLEEEKADWIGLATLVPAIASAVTYFLTEDMRGRMTAADKWTALMLLFFAAETGILYWSLRSRQDSNEQ